MNTLFIDITELVGWGGKLTGVPRVMHELAIRFEKDDEYEVCFCSWDKERKVMRKINTVPEQFLYEDSKNKQKSRDDYVLNSIKKIIRSSRFLSLFTEVSIGSIRRLKRKLVLITTRVEEINPIKGDLLFILSEWHGNNPTFIEYLRRIKSSGVRLIHFSHDLLPIVAPQYTGHATGYFKNYARRIYPHCSLILVNSKHTKKDIENWLNKEKLKTPKIEVVRLGDDFKITKPHKPTNVEFLKTGLKGGDFLLCVGTIESRKNHMLLYYTYKLASHRGVNLPKLLLVGRKGWGSECFIDTISNDPDVNNQIIFMHDINDNVLSWLYDNCLFTIYPSFYEGWGLPIAESIAHDRTCLCSSTSSMPEVAGDLITYFSPFSVDDCLSGIMTLLKFGNLAKAEKKLKDYKTTSWDETYEQVKAIIKTSI